MGRRGSPHPVQRRHASRVILPKPQASLDGGACASVMDELMALMRQFLFLLWSKPCLHQSG